MNKNKIILIINIIIFLIYLNFFYCYGSTKLEGIENFPNSYKPYLYQLNQKHPNWKFTALYTNLDWNYAIQNENIFGKNLVPISYSDVWKNTKQGEYNIEVDKGWVDSSKSAVEFAMDPRNFLNDTRIMQFEGLTYSDKTNNQDTIEKILYGTEFYNRIVQYLTSYGNTITMSEKYSDLILRAGQTSQVNPYHLASRIKQEVGPFLSHSSISGNVTGFEGLYNFYNIGATSSAEPMGAIKNGLQYAKDGKGASEIIKLKYLIPWNTKERAITGGAIFIGSGYINIGQNTIYLQKFDVNDDKQGELFWHQYMTNVLAPYSESKSIYNGYSNSEILDSLNSFIIPVYNNMPNEICENPNIFGSDFKVDDTKVYANVSTTLNIRNGPGTQYDSIIQINKNEIMTRILKGNQSGELWDKVKLENGIVGYAFQSYLEVYKKPEEPVEPSEPEKPVEPEPEEPEPPEIEQPEEDIPEMPSIPKEDLKFDESLKIDVNKISGIDYKNNAVQDIKNKISTIYRIEIYNKNDELLTDKSLVGTGSKIKFFDDNDEEIVEYKFVLYGDVNGDGKINSIDLLVLQRHILELEKFSGVFLKAGNISKNGKNPSSLDALLIQRHILELAIIEQ